MTTQLLGLVILIVTFAAMAISNVILILKLRNESRIIKNRLNKLIDSIVTIPSKKKSK